MTVLNELYRCDICGNIVEIVQEGADALVCCGEEMKKIEAETQEPVKGEKHTPVLVNGEDGEFYIKVGETEHPMTDEHFIAFIEAISTDGNSNANVQIWLQGHCAIFTGFGKVF